LLEQKLSYYFERRRFGLIFLDEEQIGVEEGKKNFEKRDRNIETISLSLNN